MDLLVLFRRTLEALWRNLRSEYGYRTVGNFSSESLNDAKRRAQLALYGWSDFLGCFRMTISLR